MKGFLIELKAGEIAEMVLLKPDASPEDLNPSSVMDDNVLEGFTKQRATRLGSEILKNPEDPVYPLVKEYSDVESKHPPSQLPPDRGCEVIDVSFAKKAKPGMGQKSKPPHSTPTFCARKPNGNWHLVHAYNKLNNATVPAQTPISRKGVFVQQHVGLEHPECRAEDDKAVMEVHMKHLRRVFGVRAYNLHANIDKRVFAADEIKALYCFVPWIKS
ncbi:Pol protein [Phytophthora palmivora]|uniref:Pol protein n=1 Tax=Phytophthora palmivora TaxID=4796 RepID=A0A2P4YMU2_9STRA|nr:Pol protein [Phytophthora palmivora]